MDVAVVTVGDEILVGDTVNTNAAWLGQQLRDQGVTVQRMITLPDRVADIAQVVNEYRAAYDGVIVTGGLGPTHDDVTMAAVAAAVGTTLAANDDVRNWLHKRGYSNDDLAPETTQIPAGARFLRNPEGVAPGCVIENIYVLPGVPTEMKAMFELIRDEFEGTTQFVKVVRTAEPESALLERISDVRSRFDVDVGSYPGDNVRLKIYGENPAAVDEAATWLRDHVQPPT